MAGRYRRLLLLLLLAVCTFQRTRAFENPFAKWLAASEELLEQPEEAAKVHKVEEDEDQHEQQPEDQPEEEEEETHYKQVDEEDERPSEGIPPPSPEHESKPQTPLAAHYERASKQQSPQDASVDDQQTHDDRRVEAAAERNDEPDEFADLEGIDLSPFNMYIADRAVLVRLLDWAYDRTALLSRFQDGFVHAEELSRLFSLALNPTEENVPDEYTALIDAAADEMRDVQGLVDSDMAVPRGFVGRGMPLRTLQRLAQQMHEHHSRRRLASTGTRDREL